MFSQSFSIKKAYSIAWEWFNPLYYFYCRILASYKVHLAWGDDPSSVIFSAACNFRLKLTAAENNNNCSSLQRDRWTGDNSWWENVEKQNHTHWSFLREAPFAPSKYTYTLYCKHPRGLETGQDKRLTGPTGQLCASTRCCVSSGTHILPFVYCDPSETQTVSWNPWQLHIKQEDKRTDQPLSFHYTPCQFTIKSLSGDALIQSKLQWTEFR